MIRVQRAPRPWRRPLREVNQEPAPWAYRYPVLRAARALIPVFMRRHWSGQENIARHGGLIVIGNHISNVDPIPVGEYLIYSGRWPRFLGKAEIWKWPVAGWVARATDQIPVYRGSKHAGEALINARRALEQGKAVMIYPEGTISADPELWPMTGRRGAALLALQSGVPVVPLAQWGAHRVMGGRYVEWRMLLSGRSDVHLHAGPPIDISGFAARVPEGSEPSKELLDELTEHFLDVLAEMVGELREEPPPRLRWDMRVGGRVDSRSH